MELENPGLLLPQMPFIPTLSSSCCSDDWQEKNSQENRVGIDVGAMASLLS